MYIRKRIIKPNKLRGDCPMPVEPINDKHAVAIHAAKFVKNGMLSGFQFQKF